MIPLENAVYKYHDGLTEHQINDMRVRAHQRAKHAAQEKAQKMKIAAGIASLTSEDYNSKNATDIMKKDMTTDHEGKAIAVRQLKGDKLPSTMPSTTKSTVA